MYALWPLLLGRSLPWEENTLHVNTGLLVAIEPVDILPFSLGNAFDRPVGLHGPSASWKCSL